MSHDETPPTVVPVWTESLKPPRIPFLRRVSRAAARFWPLAVWCGSLAAAVWMYSGLTDKGHALAQAPILEVRVSPAVSARVAALQVRVGDEVAAGDLVASFDASEVDAELRLARARLERSRTRITAVRAKLEQDLAERRAQAAARKASHASEGRRIRTTIDGLSAEESADRAELAAVTPQIERLRPLAEQNLITRERLEELEQSHSVLEARVSAHAERIRSSQEELALWEQLAPATPAESDLDAHLVPFELELQAREAQVAQLELERTAYELHAPAAGTVQRIVVRPGEWAEAGDEIVALVVGVPDHVDAFVPGAHARSVGIGTCVTLHPRDRAGPPVEGRVLGLGARMEPMPRQLWALPSLPEWGRRVSIGIALSEDPLPGEVYTVRFR